MAPSAKSTTKDGQKIRRSATNATPLILREGSLGAGRVRWHWVIGPPKRVAQEFIESNTVIRLSDSSPLFKFFMVRFFLFNHFTDCSLT